MSIFVILKILNCLHVYIIIELGSAMLIIVGIVTSILLHIDLICLIASAEIMVSMLFVNINVFLIYTLSNVK